MVSALVRRMSDLAEAAIGVTTRDEYRREVLRQLDKAIGLDFGITWTIPESSDGATIVGFPVSFWRQFLSQRDRYMTELLPLMKAVLQQGAVDDRDVFDSVTRGRLAMYGDIIRPVGSRNFLTAALGVRGKGASLMQIGRSGLHGSLFGRRNLEQLRRLLPIISLGEALHDSGPRATRPDSYGLTPREREIVSYVVLGFTNREIGLACGTSANTVHNQLRSVFVKLHVANRAELVRVAVTDGLE
jgi:DNA-binding CsgD family transcriptional regulator